MRRSHNQEKAAGKSPADTRDGDEIGLHMNAGLVVDLPHLDESGAQSIGLFRTELQFMLALRFPRLSAQEQLYVTLLDAAGEPLGPVRTPPFPGAPMASWPSVSGR